MVVAHPDDETLWMGGTILKNINNWDTTIISLCRAKDPDRAPKFHKVCKILNAKCFISDLEDEKLNKINLSEVKKRIKKFAGNDYDLVFTHGATGEYGHVRHIDVHNAVKNMISRREIKCKELWCFDYTNRGSVCVANSKPDKFIKLERVYLLKKRELIHDVYGFNKKSFEYLCIKKSEAFKIIKIK